MSTITAIKDASRAVPRAPQSTSKPLPGRKMLARLKRQRMAATALGTVAVTLTALSLSHLVQGIEIVTHAQGWEAWVMAIGVDLGFVSLELAQVATTTETLRRSVKRYTAPAIIGTLAGSAVMNAFAFASHATGICMTTAAIVMGVAIPALIYALTRIGAALYIDGSK